MAGYQACESPDNAAGGLSDDDWFVCDDEVKTPASKVSKMGGGPLTPKPLTPGRPTQDLGSKMNAMTEEDMAAEVACRQRAASQQAAKSAAHKKLHLGISKTPLKRRTPQKRPQPLTSGGNGSEVAPRTATEQGKPGRRLRSKTPPLKRPAETVGAKVGAEVGSNLQKTVGRPKAENATTFAGRRPPVTPGQDPLWDLRKQLYWTVRKEMAEQYPGKVHLMPSAPQVKYWKFMSDFMKSHPACPGEPSRETLKQGAQAYLELLAEELKSTSAAQAAGRRMLHAEGELVFNSETPAPHAEAEHKEAEPDEMQELV